MTTAKGDKTTNFQSISTTSTLTIQPPSGEEWSIHNIYWGGASELYATDGTHNILVGSSTGAGGRLNNYFNCTNTQYFLLKNITAGSIYMGFDGVVTKISA